MIVISGALVLVALVLLIVGVVGPDLTFVYASIGVSLVSLVFLVIGILQRRGDTGAEAVAPAPDVAERPTDDVTTVLPSQVGTSRRVTEREPLSATAEQEHELAGTVLVVEGRPRYHVDGCRYLSGKQTATVDVRDAREEGFSPCGVCKPDDALAERAEPVVQEQDEPAVEPDAPEVKASTRAAKAPATRAVKAPANRAAAAKTAPASTVAAAPVRTVAAAPARKGVTTVAAAPARKATSTAASKPASKATSKATSKPASKAAAAATASTPAAASAASKPGSVVVIPDRGKFHQAACRYVRDVPEAEVLSRSAATRQGYAACGVCKP